MSRWFRFYNNAVHDPKVQRLPGEKFKAWVNLLCIASENGGVLPDLRDLCHILRLSETKASSILDDLCAIGLLDPIEVANAPMSYEPHNWAERQFKSDVSNQRVSDYRKRKRNVTPPVTPIPCNVTPAVTVTPPEQSRTDTEQNRKKEALPSVALIAIEPKPKTKKRAGPIPDDWAPSLKHYQLAEQLGQDVQRVEAIFRDYIASHGKTYLSYDAAFNTFIRNQRTYDRGSNEKIRVDTPRGGSLIAALDRQLERSIAEDADRAEAANVVQLLPARSVSGP